MSELKDELEKIRALHPNWIFSQCWAELKRTKPELFHWREHRKPQDRLRALAREQAEKKARAQEQKERMESADVRQFKRLYRAVTGAELKKKLSLSRPRKGSLSPRPGLSCADVSRKHSPRLKRSRMAAFGRRVGAD